jgi:hypothetical protein
MKKFLKGYFLFFAAHPIFYSLVLATMAIIIAYLWTGAPLPQEGEPNKPLIIVLTVMCLHATIVYVVISKYITRNVKLWIEYSDEDSILFSYVSTKNGKNIIFSKPIWLKGEVTYVHRPSNYHYFNNASLNEIGRFTVKTELICNYKNLTVSVPVALSITLDDKFNKSEVLTALTKNGKVFTTNNIDCYLSYCFRTINKERQDQFDELAKRLAERNLSELDFLGEVMNLISFPEKLFSNFKKTSIKVGNPTIACEKGADTSTLRRGVIEVNV